VTRVRYPALLPWTDAQPGVWRARGSNRTRWEAVAPAHALVRRMRPSDAPVVDHGVHGLHIMATAGSGGGYLYRHACMQLRGLAAARRTSSDFRSQSCTPVYPNALKS